MSFSYQTTNDVEPKNILESYVEWMVKDNKWSRSDIISAVQSLGYKCIADISNYADFYFSVDAALSSARHSERGNPVVPTNGVQPPKWTDESRVERDIPDHRKTVFNIPSLPLSTESSRTPSCPQPKLSRFSFSDDDEERETLCVAVYLPTQPLVPLLMNVEEKTSWITLFDLTMRAAQLSEREKEKFTLTRLSLCHWPPTSLSLRVNRRIDPSMLTSSTPVFPSLSRSNNEDNLFELRRSSLVSIGGCFALSSLLDFNPSCDELRAKTRELDIEHGYCAFREIRGDGNCYYRAVLYGALEKVVQSPRRAMFLRRWRRVFSKIDFPAHTESSVVRRHQMLLHILQDAAEGKMWPTAQHVEADFIDDQTEVDIAFVTACKHAVSAFLLSHRDKEFNGISLEMSIRAPHEDITSLEQYCVQEVLKMGQCAEGAHVDLGILPALLGFRCEIAMLYSDSTPIAVQQCAELSIFPSSPNDPPQPLISLLFRPGHYDLLYSHKYPSHTVHESSRAKALARSRSEDRHIAVSRVPSSSTTKQTSSLRAIEPEHPVALLPVRSFDCWEMVDKQSSRPPAQTSGGSRPEILSSTTPVPMPSPRLQVAADKPSTPRDRSRSRVKMRPGSSAAPKSKRSDDEIARDIVRESALMQTYFGTATKTQELVDSRKDVPISETLSRQELLETNEEMFSDVQNVTNYYFLVKEMELPSPLVLDAMVTYHNTCLVTIMEVVQLLRDRVDFSVEQCSRYKAKPEKNESVRQICRQCLQLGIAVNDIIYSLAQDNVFSINDLLNNLESRKKTISTSSPPREESTDAAHLSNESDNNFNSVHDLYASRRSAFAGSDLQERVNRMGRNDVIAILQKHKLFNESLIGLPTKDLRERLLSKLSKSI